VPMDVQEVRRRYDAVLSLEIVDSGDNIVSRCFARCVIYDHRAMIAGTAISAGAPLATSNMQDFRRFVP